jgi:hypothetical protein
VTHHFTPETENIDLYDAIKNMVLWQPLTACTD